MELLLHYTWQNRLFPQQDLQTTQGEPVEVVQVGLHNHDAGPDFLEARVRIGGVLWAGHVEIHTRASDWNRHHHEQDAAYNNVILHVVAEDDVPVQTQSGHALPTLVIAVPEQVKRNYAELLAEEKYPPCYRIIPQVKPLVVNAYLSRLTAERLEEKTARISALLERTKGDWEAAYFATLARAFGFGVNSEVFEQWALNVHLSQVAKHRDNLQQVEAYFFGQAGLLNECRTTAAADDAYFQTLVQEYAFLRAKFDLEPMAGSLWRLLRMRPQNFPHLRLAQLARLHHEGRTSLASLLAATDVKSIHRLFAAGVSPYWETHYTFAPPHLPDADAEEGSVHKALREPKSSPRILQKASLNLLLINAAAPVLFAYGRAMGKEPLCERALEMLASTPAEQNYITRCWRVAGLEVSSAADSQALFRLRRAYCDAHRCLDCRFGAEYLRRVPLPKP